MSWILLILAGVFEIAWAIGLKYTEGFTRLWPSIFTVVALVLSFVAMGLAIKELPLGVAYAVWVGIGAAGTFILSVLFLGESMNTYQALSVLLIVSGVVGLKLGTV